ncbi:MAG: hypothetical protein QOD94_115, partial [Alphaproteobacteria bacterium]|nr:hypothetical protein [Alphaproteobacteria bacterium]
AVSGLIHTARVRGVATVTAQAYA